MDVLLGKGAFGEVFKCWFKGTEGKEQVFALKILNKDLANIDAQMLKNEFEITINATHPNIIRTFDLFQDAEFFYVV